MDIIERLYQSYYNNKVPLIVVFELTKRCVNRCIHCYLPETHQKKLYEKELSFNEIKRALDEMRELGVIFLNLTGGEPVLRDDIEKIIKKAVSNNFYVKLFTSLNFDHRIFERLYDIGLREIDVSLYGKRDTHNFVCRSDCFDRVIENIKRLKEKGYKINIKTPLMNLNLDDIEWVYKFSKKYKCGFFIDPVITPLNDGDGLTLKYLVDFNLAFNKINKFMKFSKSRYKSSQDNYRYFCGALRTIIGIDCYGKVFPCLAFPFEVGDIKEKSLKEIFYSNYSEALRKIIEEEPLRCRLCRYKDFCSRCVGLSWVYKKDFEYTYKQFCKIAKIFCLVFDNS